MYPVDGRNSPDRNFIHRSAHRLADCVRAHSRRATDFAAQDYDRLVDSPVEIGLFEESDFDQGAATIAWLWTRIPPTTTCRRSSPCCRAWSQPPRPGWMTSPFRRYLFLYHFPRGPAGGGMEHAYSTAIDISASRLARESAIAGRCHRARILSSVERKAHPARSRSSPSTTPKRTTPAHCGSAKARPPRREILSACGLACSMKRAI